MFRERQKSWHFGLSSMNHLRARVHTLIPTTFVPQTKCLVLCSNQTWPYSLTFIRHFGKRSRKRRDYVNPLPPVRTPNSPTPSPKSAEDLLNVSKPTMVYRHLSPWRFRLMAAGGALQFGWWTSYLQLLSREENDSVLQLSPYMGWAGMVTAVAFCCAGWFYAKRYVTELTLLDSTRVKVKTHTFIGTEREFTTSQKKISKPPGGSKSMIARSTGVKLTGELGYYLIDSRAKFYDSARLRALLRVPLHRDIW